MTEGIFDFWNEAGAANKIHPRDAAVLSRVKHGFDTECFPMPFMGPLKSAPVVLLFLNAGFCAKDAEDGKTEDGRSRYVKLLEGLQPLPAPEEHEPAWRWWSRRTRDFGKWRQLRDKVAILA